MTITELYILQKKMKENNHLSSFLPVNIYRPNKHESIPKFLDFNSYFGGGYLP